MYAVIFSNGTQLQLTYNDVYGLIRDKNVAVTSAKTNGSQTVFTAHVSTSDENYSERWQIVANTYSQGEQELYLAMHA